MIVQVDPTAPLAVYEQLRVQISRLITSGELPAGAQLPTIRQLAADMNLAKDTVGRTYELLERDRLVERRGRRGTVVVDRPLRRADAAAAVAKAADDFALAAVQLGIAPDDACAAVRRAMTAIV